MSIYEDALGQLVDQFAKLPGIGRKSAQRLAFHVLKMPKAEAYALAKSIVKAKETIHTCKRCFNLTDEEYCSICRNPHRDTHTICVVEDAKDIAALERVGAYQGLYHVLGGVISPMDGITPDMLHIRELLERIQKEEIREVILATNISVEGEATAMYLSSLLRIDGCKITRIAQGLPVGGDIQYADEITLARAFQGRWEM